MNEQIAAHYEAGFTNREELLARINAQIDTLPKPLSVETLAGFDQFHIGGLAATTELARRVAPTSALRVLDAGSGLGGPSRYLAEAFGCHVMGIDLAPAYGAIATLVAEKLGLSDRVSYRTGTITQLPFEDGEFDLVWTQHVVMNIADRDRLYRELRRVLKPGGRLAFYDPYAPTNANPPIYPVPWAETCETSTLLTQVETLASLASAGFTVSEWEDVTRLGLGWVGRQQQGLQAQQPSTSATSLSPGLVVGPRIAGMIQNFGRNLREGRVALVMGLGAAE